MNDRRLGMRMRNDLLIRFDPNWVAFGPPLIVTEADIDEMVAVLELSIWETLQEL